jgi:hypothetical protein
VEEAVSASNTVGQSNTQRSSTESLKKGDFFNSLFSHCISDGTEMNEDEVDKYLTQRCEDPSIDPIDYWKVHCKQFPGLSTVAKDILPIPGSSVAVERIFNCGRDMLGLRRYSLKPETFSALMFGKYALKK